MKALKEFIEYISNLGPTAHMFFVWILTNVFWIIIVISLVIILTPKPVEFSQQQDFPNQEQTQQYKYGE